MRYISIPLSLLLAALLLHYGVQSRGAQHPAIQSTKKRRIK